MLYNKDDTYAINTVLDRWLNGEPDSVYDDGYGYEEDDDYDDI